MWNHFTLAALVMLVTNITSDDAPDDALDISPPMSPPYHPHITPCNTPSQYHFPELCQLVCSEGSNKHFTQKFWLQCQIPKLTSRIWILCPTSYWVLKVK